MAVASQKQFLFSDLLSTHFKLTKLVVLFAIGRQERPVVRTQTRDLSGAVHPTKKRKLQK